MREQQIKRATELGAQAFRSGLKAAPALCVEFMKMIDGRAVGASPAGEASNIELLKSWIAGWHSTAADAFAADLAQLMAVRS
ncbi:MAG: hypothetical protein BGP24_14805 [Lysobacterales bacterium 69-70]|nr:hypothetical protein [Xanthomonadaceae bacterium]ODU35355.1 MAG: hypothetical protein ABS97_05635 [Xanthomonadaceae bacterium SCN 69-320]ODV17182.1 MAG: hypothetical protein ABT27_17605 [Xanthomonadaceae bacterium SCN 69-25]OJY94251.1 MAG: hypothetical protein BGP24_14805 [Xanthomonadales bacterium 69-70]